MLAGVAHIDITPDKPVWMEGMIRTHKSEGVHDHIYARALVLANNTDPAQAVVLAYADLCVMNKTRADYIRNKASVATGIPVEQMIIATTHTHSGPSTSGLLGPIDEEYTEKVLDRIASVIIDAYQALQPAEVAIGSGKEGTISHYRRLLADDGHVVMNWEPFPAERIIGPLGVIDPELGVLKVTLAGDSARTLAILFNHAGHPNVLSGDNYLISGDYPGLAQRRLSETYNTTAIFLNGAQGTMDIDGLRDRDWEGLSRVGNALADAVERTIGWLPTPANLPIVCNAVSYILPARIITDEEYAWAEKILAQTGGTVAAVADGVGDDYKANLYMNLRKMQDQNIPCDQVCIAMGDAAWISVPAELYTEIGLKIKALSPFRHTYVLAMANGNVGYIPTPVAIVEGGYAEDTRCVDSAAEQIILQQSAALLTSVFKSQQTKGVHP